MKTVRPSSHRAYPRRGFALVITLVMVALLAIITVGVFMSVSLERVTAKSYNDRYQADLAVQNGLEAVKKTLVTSPSALPSPSPASATGTDTFLFVRASKRERSRAERAMGGNARPAGYRNRARAQSSLHSLRLLGRGFRRLSRRLSSGWAAANHRHEPAGDRHVYRF